MSLEAIACELTSLLYVLPEWGDWNICLVSRKRILFITFTQISISNVSKRKLKLPRVSMDQCLSNLYFGHIEFVSVFFRMLSS